MYVVSISEQTTVAADHNNHTAEEKRAMCVGSKTGETQNGITGANNSGDPSMEGAFGNKDREDNMDIDDNNNNDENNKEKDRDKENQQINKGKTGVNADNNNNDNKKNKEKRHHQRLLLQG